MINKPGCLSQLNYKHGNIHNTYALKLVTHRQHKIDIALNMV